MVRDHNPITIEEFNGLWARGDIDSCPLDHFTDTNNISFSESAFGTRDGFDTYSATRHPVRMYEYNATGLGLEGLIILNNVGEIHHVIGLTDFLVMTIPTMTDFGFVEFDGRCYISPSTNTGPGGLAGEKVWVYLGDQMTPGRVAAGVAPVNADGLLAVANSATVGSIEAGIHIFGVVYETDTGYLTAIGPDTLPVLTATGGFKADLTNIDVSPNAYVKKRHIVATRAIDPSLYTGNTQGYQFFFLPDGVIPDNVTTIKTVDFFDSELLDDASHLFDNYSSIPAGGGLGLYHNRLLDWDSDVGPASVLVSAPGEPEAISQVDGLILVPFQGQGITHCHEYRDVLYICKINSTIACSDNGDVPSSWQTEIIDQGIGAAKHGIAIVGEVGSINIEFLLVFNLSGIFVFNGTYTRPELSYKIKDFWLSIDLNTKILLSEFYNDVLNQIIAINFPYLNMILIGDYSNGLDFKAIKWAKWTIATPTTTMALIGKTNTFLLGSNP